MIGYGSVARPYQEHPAEPITQVHWAGGLAVKWNYSQFMYLDGALPVGNSPTGTMSVWLKFTPELAAYGAGVASLFFSGWMDFEVTTRSDFRTQVVFDPVTYAYHKFKFSPASAEAFFGTGPNTFGYLVDNNAAFPATGTWYHLFAQWDTGAGSLLIKVNGVTIGTATYPGSAVIPGDLGFPFDVSWAYPVNDDSTPNSSQFLSNANMEDVVPTGFSIAEYWMDNTAATALTVDKFVDLTTGRPKPLGANGELPKLPATGDTRPAFFFARSGAPQTFVANRGYGGTFQFARGHYGSDLSFTVEDIADPSTDPPLDEPDNPHYTPAASMAA
jgi:hypothetical protein